MKNLRKKCDTATGDAETGAHKKRSERSYARLFVGCRSGRTRRNVLCAIFIAVLVNTCALGWAEDKSWTAAGDASDWFDAANWLPAVAPTASDDVMINKQDASVALPQAFDAKSITLGGKKESSLTISNFAAGTVAPDNSTDLAIHNRRDGNLILKGSAGILTLKGGYKDSEEVIPDEPSFMFYVE